MNKLPKIQLKKRFLTAITLFFVLSIIGTATAQEIQRTYTVINPAINHTLKPGEVTEGTTKVINQSNVPLTFKLNVQDYIVNDTKGTPNFLPPDTLNTKYSAAAWIGVTPSTFTIKPGATQVINYYVQVPADAAPGGHYAGIVYAPVSEVQQEATGGTVNTQIGSLFYLNVSGPITEKAEVSIFNSGSFHEYGPVKILTQIKNMGDLHISPKATITVSGLLFKETVDLVSQNIYPQTARDFENSFGQTLMLGRYKAELIGSYGQENNMPLVATMYFWVFPWKLALIIVLVIVAVVLGTLYYKKHKKNGPKAPQEPKTEDKDRDEVEQKTS